MQIRYDIFSKLEDNKPYRVAQSFYIQSDKDLDRDFLKKILHDPVSQRIEESILPTIYKNKDYRLDVHLHKGMTDELAKSVLSIWNLKYAPIKIKSFQSYYFLESDLTEEKIIGQLEKSELNSVIHFYKCFKAKDLEKIDDFFIEDKSFSRNLEILSFDRDWLKFSEDRFLALNKEELSAIRMHFQNLDRPPTDVELEVIAQTWSEHCKHKIFSAAIDYTESEEVINKLGNKKINGLFPEIIKKTVKPHHKACVSVFHDNAGVIRWDNNLDVCIKVETHNSPSALDPYSGAITGVLGVQRDIMGTGIGAKPIANLDVFCVGIEEDFPEVSPPNLMRPNDILKGVHKGVEDGGNKMGVPTVNGSIQYHPSFSGKPLVFVGSVGIMPQKLEGKDTHIKKIDNGDLVYVGGGRLGRDGIHGATFSSLNMEKDIPQSVVQLGDPITQKRLLDFTLKARDLGYIKAITDNGAGGISSSIGEMAQLSGGVEIDISKHPLKYKELNYFEMVISESQERMSYAVAPNNQEAFEKLSKDYGVEVSNLGVFNDSGRFLIRFEDMILCDLSLDFLHNSCPKKHLTALWTGPKKEFYWHRNTKKKDYHSWQSTLLDLLASPNIRSKKDFISSYDQEVQGASIQKPFCGKDLEGPSSAAALSLEQYGGGKNTAIALAHGFSAKRSFYDTYWMTLHAVDEAVRNLVASGVNPEKIVLLDNFCWPDSENDEYRVAQLVRANLALKDISEAYDYPFVSGKDSMKNTYKNRELKIDVEPSLLITALGYIEHTNDIVSTDFKTEGDLVYRLGYKSDTLLGSDFSYYYDYKEAKSKETKPKDWDLNAHRNLYKLVFKSIKEGLIQSCQDISDGGLLVAVAESCIGANLGVKLDLEEGIENLFSEPMASFVVSVEKEKQKDLELIFSNLNHLQIEKIGEVTNSSDFIVNSEGLNLMDLKRSFGGLNA